MSVHLISVGQRLYDLTKEVDEIIVREEKNDLFPNHIREEARSVGIALSNAQVMYAPILKTYIAYTDATVRAQFVKLDRMIAALKGAVVEPAISMKARVTEFIDSLDLPYKLTDIVTRYAVVTNNRFTVDFKVDCSTTFSTWGSTYGLVIDDCKTKNTEKTAEKISFESEAQEGFFPIAKKDRFTVFKAKVMAHYLSLSGRFSVEYNVWLATYPVGPFKITTFYSRYDYSEKIERVFRSADITLKKEDFKPGRWITLLPSPGFKIMKPVWRIAERERIEIPRNRVRDESAEILLMPGTFYVEFEEFRHVVRKTKVSENYELFWGKTFTVFDADDYKIVVESFQGKKYEFGKNDPLPSFLKYEFSNVLHHQFTLVPPTSDESTDQSESPDVDLPGLQPSLLSDALRGRKTAEDS